MNVTSRRALVVLIAVVLLTILLSAYARGALNNDGKEYQAVAVSYQVSFQSSPACHTGIAGQTFYTQSPPSFEFQSGGEYWLITLPQYWRAEGADGYSEGLGLKTIGSVRCQVIIANIDKVIKVAR